MMGQALSGGCPLPSPVLSSILVSLPRPLLQRLHVPRIFDNLAASLLPALQQTLITSERADFCIGYFNLRGWKSLCQQIEHFEGGAGRCCRLLIGMHQSESEELQQALRISHTDARLDNATALRQKQRLAAAFRNQLMTGAPTNEDERTLRQLAAQIRSGKVRVKLFLRHALHAKLYLLFPNTFNLRSIGFLGSSNLTFSGLRGQGELNVDVKDDDACQKLEQWFEDRWNDRWCLDISDELVQVINESWAREDLVPPYHIYLKIAYHLAHEALLGLKEFNIPRDFGDQLFDYQVAAVKIAARHLNERNGVLIGDVVGLGKTLMATALARIFEDDYGLETLILCPKNLVEMWEDHRIRYRLRARVLSITRAHRDLADLTRFRQVIIDESHNLRNREGKRYSAIRDYIARMDSKCILLTATPYNKSYLDLSSQLRLFLPEDHDLGIRPEALLREIGVLEFGRRHSNTSPRSLAAFEKSVHADDWRDLMRLFLVRRTRTFIKENYALADCTACGTALQPGESRCSHCTAPRIGTEKRYLLLTSGQKSYFPLRQPCTLAFRNTTASGQPDAYARLYAEPVVEVINALRLPRYGLGNYVRDHPDTPPTAAEQKILDDLSRAGKRLMGFSRTNLFKRLESSGAAFLQSIERHLLRNYLFIHALEQRLPLPIGPQDAAMLDPASNDTDSDLASTLFDPEAEEAAGAEPGGPLFEPAAPVQPDPATPATEASFLARAAETYSRYQKNFFKRFKWLRTDLFKPSLKQHLREDARALLNLLHQFGTWNPAEDAKLEALVDLLTHRHPHEKVLLFSQFADTVSYLEGALQARGLPQIAAVTGATEHPTHVAWRFSPVSNDKRQQVSDRSELRVLLTTDVLSEGQNLQDAHIVVNYDLPWALIRLIQRAGRVDRIGQQAERILCYSFLPAEGVEKIIRLRERVRQRLRENAEVVGSDEAFFEDTDDQVLIDLYHEKSGLLDGEEDREVDLASMAYQIWHNATSQQPRLRTLIEQMPHVVYTTKPHEAEPGNAEGVLVYLRTQHGTDAMAWLDREGRSITESPLAILKAAECTPDTPALPRLDQHHALVSQAVDLITREERNVGGQLGRPSGARFRTYERLKAYLQANPLFATTALQEAFQALYRYPLRQTAIDTLNRQLRSHISDHALAELVVALHTEDKLCIIHAQDEAETAQILCSMGLKHPW